MKRQRTINWLRNLRDSSRLFVRQTDLTILYFCQNQFNFNSISRADQLQNKKQEIRRAASRKKTQHTNSGTLQKLPSKWWPAPRDVVTSRMEDKNHTRNMYCNVIRAQFPVLLSVTVSDDRLLNSCWSQKILSGVEREGIVRQFTTSNFFSCSISEACGYSRISRSHRARITPGVKCFTPVFSPKTSPASDASQKSSRFRGSPKLPSESWSQLKM
jgi:hypothetical protein